MSEITIEEVAQAARSGDSLLGMELQPYTPSRVVAAQTMGMRFPMIPEEHYEQLEKTGFYPGIYSDAAIVIWLCTLPDKLEKPDDVWTPRMAQRSPDKAWDVAMEWADRNCMFEPQHPNFAEAVKIFMSRVLHIQVAQFEISVEGEAGGGGDDQGPKV